MGHEYAASLINEILSLKIFAVVGASRDTTKAGHTVYTRLKAAGYTVYPVNPSATEIDGDPCYPHLDALPAKPDCVVFVTPPSVTEQAVHAAGHLHVPYAWMQPGAESVAATNLATALGLRTISGGPCIMVAIGQRSTI